MGNEDSESLFEVIETWQATDVWHAMRKLGREHKSWDELHGAPMADDMIAVFPEVMREIRERRAAAQTEEGDE